MVPVYVLIAIVIIIVLFYFFRYVKKKELELKADFNKRFAGRNIHLLDKYALYIAQQSDGYSHSRGIGYLVLTDDELYYKRQLGNKVLSIPLASITGVEETRRLSGQSHVKPMLKVSFRNKAGQEDAVAWVVKEREQWIRQIQMKR